MTEIEAKCKAAREAAGEILCPHARWQSVCPACIELRTPKPPIHPGLVAALAAAQKPEKKK